MALLKEAEVFLLGRGPVGGQDSLRAEAPAALRHREKNLHLGNPQSHQRHKILGKATPFEGGLLGSGGGRGGN